MQRLTVYFLMLLSFATVRAQQVSTKSSENRVPLTELAVALDASGLAALEAKLGTSALNGTPEIPVTNARMIIRNSSEVSYAFVSGLVTFYDAAGVRCGEGLFKADALAAGESFETDTPGLRIRCTPVSWRIVATSLVLRTVPDLTTSALNTSQSRLLISVDDEVHPIQLGKPMTINFGDKQRTIVIRQAP